MLDKGNDAIDGILALAKEGEHPRAYEVAGQLIKTVADVSKDLLELQEKLKKIKDVPNTGPKSVTNALFVGSTTELQKLLKGKKKMDEDEYNLDIRQSVGDVGGDFTKSITIESVKKESVLRNELVILRLNKVNLQLKQFILYFMTLYSRIAMFLFQSMDY